MLPNNIADKNQVPQRESSFIK